jgi:hypothetical protein
METIGAVRVGMRVYYSSYHLWAARHFAQIAREIEATHGGRAAFNITHRSYVTTTVLCTIGFLEAAINELFKDASDNHCSYLEPLGADRVAVLAERWKENARRPLPRRSILEKYTVALECLDKTTFNRGEKFYQDLQLLARLRNALTHFHPETRYQDTLDKLGADLKERGFPSNRLMLGSANPYFPDHCLGAGCAGWAVETARGFADTFFLRIGVQAHYQRTDFGPP